MPKPSTPRDGGYQGSADPGQPHALMGPQVRPITMTTVEIVRRALDDLTARRRALEPLVNELDALTRAIKDINALLLRLEGKHDGSKSGQRTRAWEPAADAQAGKILTLLRENPRGLHSKVITRSTGLPANSVESTLPRLMQAGYVERPTRGFYRIAGGAPAIEGHRGRSDPT